MNIAEGIALVIMSLIYYPFVAPILTLFLMFMTLLGGGNVQQFGYIWSVPFLVAKGNVRFPPHDNS